MNELGMNISPEETQKIRETIQKIAHGPELEPPVKPEPITSWEMAKIFSVPHIRIFNRIAKFISVEASEEEKKEFASAQRIYNRNRQHPIWNLTEKGCQLYIDRMCIEEKRSKAFVDGLEKFKAEMERRFHGKTSEHGIVLMEGRSRAECGYIKTLFDKFVTGPAIENREIKELADKYKEFYSCLKKSHTTPAENNDLEGAVMGVAIEAEMQGFIYGFKVFETLLNRTLAAA